MADDYRFTDDQIREILAAAADRQAEADRAGAQVEGSLSLSEIQAIAGEVGIDATHVAAAARVVRHGGHALPVHSGGAKGVHLTRHVPATVSDSEWGRIVADLRSTFQEVGTSSQFGDVREWISSTSLKAGGVRVRLEPGPGGVQVTIGDSLKTMRDLRWALPGTFGTLTAAFGTLTSVAGTAPSAQAGLMALLGGLTLASVLGTQLGGRSYRDRQERRIRATLDRIDVTLRSGDDPPPDD